MAVVSHPLSVTEISLEANYGSLEAFTRAFRKAFGVSPSLYRRMGATHTHLHTANGIHHHCGNDETKGANRFMDLFDIFFGQESWHTRRLLDLAKTLSDEQLDRSLTNQIHVFPWDGPDRSLRQLLDRMIQTKEVWAAALTGGSTPLMDNAPLEERTPSAMLARLEKGSSVPQRTHSCPQPERLGGHVCRCAMRTTGDLHLWRDARARDYVQCL